MRVVRPSFEEIEPVNLGRWLGLFSLIAALYILWKMQQLLLLLFLAAIIAVALELVVRRFLALGLKRERAIFLTLDLAFLLGLALFALVVPPFLEQFQLLIALIPKAFQILQLNLVNLNQWLPDFFPSLRLSELVVRLQLASANNLSIALSFFQASLTTFSQAFFALVIALMMLANPGSYRRAFLLLFPSFYRRRADEILRESEVALASWMGGMVINCLFIGLCSGIFLSILQVRFVLVHALLAGLLNFIPNIGPLTSAIFPIAIALIDTPWKVLIIIIGYFIIQNLESYWVSPAVMQNQVSLLPAITLVAQIFFARSLGLWGLILALPLTVVAKTWIEMVLFEDILDGWTHRNLER